MCATLVGCYGIREVERLLPPCHVGRYVALAPTPPATMRTMLSGLRATGTRPAARTVSSSERAIDGDSRSIAMADHSCSRVQACCWLMPSLRSLSAHSGGMMTSGSPLPMHVPSALAVPGTGSGPPR
jgi:hypothetical protein